MKNSRLYRRALMLAVPMMIQNGITNMVTLVDNVMVGSLGTEAITAVSIVGQLIFVFSLAVFGGLSGPGIYGAQFYGSGNTEGFRNTMRIKHWIGLFCLLLGFSVFIAGKELLISLYMQGESGSVNSAQTMSYAVQYLNIMLWGLLPFVVTQIYATSLRENGESVLPMIAGVASVVIDIVFNYLLIFGKLGFPRLGVSGAAIATVMARITETLIILIGVYAVRNKYSFLDGLYRTMLIPKELAAKIIKKSVPIFLNEFLWAGSIAVLTQCYSIKGLEIVAGLNISNTLCNLFNVVFVSLGSAVGILIGQTLGASKYKEAQKNAFIMMRFSGAICFILTVILCALSPIFPAFYDTTVQIRSCAKYFIIITALFFPVQGVLNSLYFTLRSGGKTFVTFLFDGVYSWAVALPLAAILCRFTPLSILAVYAIVQSADIIKVIVGYTLIKKGIWVSNLAVELN